MLDYIFQARRDELLAAARHACSSRSQALWLSATSDVLCLTGDGPHGVWQQSLPIRSERRQDTIQVQPAALLRALRNLPAGRIVTCKHGDDDTTWTLSAAGGTFPLDITRPDTDKLPPAAWTSSTGSLPADTLSDLSASLMAFGPKHIVADPAYPASLWAVTSDTSAVWTGRFSSHRNTLTRPAAVTTALWKKAAASMHGMMWNTAIGGDNRGERLALTSGSRTASIPMAPDGSAVQAAQEAAARHHTAREEIRPNNRAGLDSDDLRSLISPRPHTTLDFTGNMVFSSAGASCGAYTKASISVTLETVRLHQLAAVLPADAWLDVYAATGWLYICADAYEGTFTWALRDVMTTS